MFSKMQHWRESIAGKLLLRFWVSLLIFFALIGLIQYQTLKYFLYKAEERSSLDVMTALQSQSFQWLKKTEDYPKTLPDLNAGVFVAYFSPDHKLQAVIGRKEVKNENQALKAVFPQWKEGKKLPSRQIVQTHNQERYLLMSRPIRATNSSLKNQSSNLPSTRPSTNSSPLNLFFNSLGLSAKSASADTLSAALSPSDPSPTNLLGYILIASPLAKIDTILNQDLIIYLNSALAVFILGGMAAAYLLRRPLKPLKRISEITEEIAEGKYTLRIPAEPAATEITQLRATLNKMLDQIEAAFATEKQAKEQMARFIADASHELRTPLTSIRGFLEILERTKDPNPQTLQTAHATMLHETERLIQLVEDLLTLNRLSQTTPVPSSPAPATALQDVLADILPLFESLKGNRRLEIKAEEGIRLPLEAGELKQILYNFIHNAIRHTDEENGIIQVKVYQTSSPSPSLILSVADNGEGIPSGDQPHLFERFFRGSRSREHKQGQGAGLGLAIVADIVQLRKGTIAVESEVGKGSEFKVIWKL